MGSELQRITTGVATTSRLRDGGVLANRLESKYADRITGHWTDQPFVDIRTP